MTRLITTIAAFILALSTLTASAAAGDQQMRGFVNPRAGSAIVVASIDAGDSMTARTFARTVSSRDIEDNFDGYVVAREAMKPTPGMSAGTMFALIDDDGTTILLVIVASGPTVYLGALLTDNLQDGDGTALGIVMGTVVNDGMSFTAPRGYTEIPMDDTTSHEFPGFEEVGL